MISKYWHTNRTIVLITGIQKYFYSILLIALCFGIFISHAFYVTKTYQYPVWDERTYIADAVGYVQIKKDNPTNLFGKINQIYSHFLNTPKPLYPLTISFPLFLFGTAHSYKIALLVNGFYYIATIILIFLLGKEFLSKKTSFLGSFIFATYGFPLFYLHFAYTETAATTFVVLSLYFLVKTDNFKKTKYIIFFAIAFALGFLTRWNVPIFIVGSLAVCLILYFFSKSKKSKQNIQLLIKNIFILCVIILIPLIFFYFPGFNSFYAYFHNNFVLGPEWVPDNMKNPFSPQSVIYYVNVLAQQTIFFNILFYTGIVTSIIFWRKYAFLLSGVVISYFFLTFLFIYKDDRFLVPMYPLIALISATLFDFFEVSKKRIWISYLLIIFTIILGLFNFLGSVWGIGPMKFSINGNNQTVPHSIVIPMPFGHPRRIWLAPISWPPRPNEGNAQRIVNQIKKDWGIKNRPPYVLRTFEMSQVGDAIASIVNYHDLGVIQEISLLGLPNNSDKSYFESINVADYILIKDGIIDDNRTKGKDIIWDKSIPFLKEFNQVVKVKNGLPKNFAPISTIAIQYDKSTLIIYKKQRDLTLNEWVQFVRMFENINSESQAKIILHIKSLNPNKSDKTTK
ncbi:MAG: glycosyltransferase family 39 protein [bacterium]|nr:glycosyltransferase family 39 protein [bacterium]